MYLITGRVMASDKRSVVKQRVYVALKLLEFMCVTFTLASPRLGITAVTFTGVRSFCVDALAVLALVGHAALINVCHKTTENGKSDHCVPGQDAKREMGI